MSRPSLSVEESITVYLTVMETRSRGYLRDVGMTLRGLQTAIGPIQARNLTPENLGPVFDRWARDNMPGTYNKKLSQVRQWLTFAHRRGHIRRHPGELLSGIDRQRVVPRKRVYLTPHQLLSVLDAARHPRDRAYLAIAMNTAMRAGEIASRRLEDLDLESGSLHILRHKTGTRDIMPITGDLDQELRRWLTFYTQQVGELKPHFYLCPAKASPLLNWRGCSREQLEAVELFPERMLTRPRYIIQRLLTAAGVPTDHEGLHTIRRSVARRLYEHLIETGEARDDALSVVQATLGHASQTITEKYIGVERFREKRDVVMRGRGFLSAMVSEENVVKLQAAVG